MLDGVDALHGFVEGAGLIKTRLQLRFLREGKERHIVALTASISSTMTYENRSDAYRVLRYSPLAGDRTMRGSMA